MDVPGPNSLIRLLKAPEDPPNPGGPSKIAIAEQVWTGPRDIPGKGDIIRDWIYSTWEKDRQGPAEGHHFDRARLDLLASILNTTSQALPTHLVSRFLRSHADVTESTVPATHTLWEQGVQRCVASSDAWIELWIDMMNFLAGEGTGLSFRLIRTIEAKIEESIELAPISKKNSLAVQNTLPAIAKAFKSHPQLSSKTLGSILYPLGSFRLSKTALPNLEALPPNSAKVQIIPRLLDALHSSIHKHRNDIFIQPTSSKTPYQTYINGKMRAMLCSAVGEAQTVLSSITAGSSADSTTHWACHRDIWRCVISWGTYLETDEGWKTLLARDVKHAKTLLQGRPETDVVGVALSFLTSAEELDHGVASLEASTLAWCLAAPTIIESESGSLLSAAFRYHRLSQTPEHWYLLVWDSIDLLLQAAQTDKARLSLHRLLTSGPLFSDQVVRGMKAIRKKNQIIDCLVARIHAVVDMNLSHAITIDVLSRCALALCPHDQQGVDSLVSAFETPMNSFPKAPKKTDPAFELSLAALIRVGRMGDHATRARLESEYGLNEISRKASTDGLREETSRWLIARIGDAPDDSEKLAKSLVSSMQGEVSQTCWEVLDRDGYTTLEHSATLDQLDAIFASRYQHELLWLLSSADILELPRVLNAMLKATLRTLSEGQQVGSMYALLASLPRTVYTKESLQAIITGASTADERADAETLQIIRRALAYLVLGSSVQVNLDYWNRLQMDVAATAENPLRVCSGELVKAIIESATTSEAELDRLLSHIVDDSSRILAAEVAISHDAARLPANVKSRFCQLASEMSKTPSAPAQTLLMIRKLQAWGEMSGVKMLSSLETFSISSLGSAELELLRLECEDDGALMSYLQLLMARSDSIAQDILKREAIALGRQTSDYGGIIECCLRWIAGRGQSARTGGFAVLAELLSVQRQGSGKAILLCREALLNTLLSPLPVVTSRISQIRAIKCLVRLRSKLLRVADVARIIAVLSLSPDAMTIDIVHAIVLTRSDLVIHVLPVIARFLCDAFDCVQETSAISLGRLLSTFGPSRRSASAAQDVPLSQPFSKHAPAILVAYVRSVVRPKVPLAIPTRKTLQTSVYTICDSVVRLQDRGREGEGIGIPFGLGETGEAEQEIWAELWKQWAKQRYKGQG